MSEEIITKCPVCGTDAVVPTRYRGDLVKLANGHSRKAYYRGTLDHRKLINHGGHSFYAIYRR